jgi:hypothetical protein
MLKEKASLHCILLENKYNIQKYLKKLHSLSEQKIILPGIWVAWHYNSYKIHSQKPMFAPI